MKLPFSSHDRFIVAHDVSGQLSEGSLVTPDRASQLDIEGAVVLPVEPRDFRASGVGGYARRGWGGGWPLDYTVPTGTCPLTLFCRPEHRLVWWAAELVPDPEAASLMGFHEHFEGQLRFTSDMGQSTPMHTSSQVEVEPMHVRELDPAKGRWTLRGLIRVEPSIAGHYGFCLYGFAPGLRVAWVAATITTR